MARLAPFNTTTNNVIKPPILYIRAAQRTLGNDEDIVESPQELMVCDCSIRRAVSGDEITANDASMTMLCDGHHYIGGRSKIQRSTVDWSQRFVALKCEKKARLNGTTANFVSLHR